MMFAAIYLASTTTLLYELNFSTSPSSEILAFIIFLSFTVLFIESLAARLLITLTNNKIQSIKFNFYVNHLTLVGIIYFFTTLYLLLEVSNLSNGIDTTAEITKFNYTEFVSYPNLYRIIYAIAPFIILIIGYGLAIANYSKKTFNLNLKGDFTIFLCVSGVIFHTLVFALTHNKSHFIITYLMYFIIPIYFLNQKNNITFFKHKYNFFVFIAFISTLFLAIFLIQYGENIGNMFTQRLSLEGQFLYATLNDFLNSTPDRSYADTLLSKEYSPPIVELMYKYAPFQQIQKFESTGWTMSGAMPGYIFIFKDYWIAFTLWILNFILLYTSLFLGLKFFISGKLLRSFIFLKFSWYFALFVSQGHNYLYNPKFWLFILILFSIYILQPLLSKHRRKPKLETIF